MIPQFSATSPFNALPTELHELICSFTETDDGSSIRNLSTVSRYFHGLVGPRLYNTICIVGEDRNLAARIRKLSAQLGVNWRDQLRARVMGQACRSKHRIRHLCLSLPLLPENDTVDAFMDIIFHCLNLESLSLYLAVNRDTDVLSYASARTHLIFLTTWPHLRELTIHGPVTFLNDKEEASIYTEMEDRFPNDSPEAGSSELPVGQRVFSPARFPAITHLHFVAPNNPRTLLSESNFTRLFPSATHLYLSQVRPEDARSITARFAADLLGRLESHDPVGLLPPSTESIRARFPPSLARIIMERADPDDFETLIFNIIAKFEARHSGLSVVPWTLDFRDVGSRFTPGLMKRFWLDRIVGRPGCWKLQRGRRKSLS